MWACSNPPLPQRGPTAQRCLFIPVKRHPEQGSICCGTRRHEGHFLGCFLMETAGPHKKYVCYVKITPWWQCWGAGTSQAMNALIDSRGTTGLGSSPSTFSFHSSANIPGVHSMWKDGNSKVLVSGCWKVLWSLFPLFEWIPLLPRLSLLPEEVDRWETTHSLGGFHNAPKKYFFSPSEIHVEMNSPSAAF